MTVEINGRQPYEEPYAVYRNGVLYCLANDESEAVSICDWGLNNLYPDDRWDWGMWVPDL